MFTIETVWESIKRRWLIILIVTIACLALGVLQSYRSNGETVASEMYKAEAAVFFSGAEESQEGEEYNYLYDDGLAITDMRRTVVSNEVAGKVREELGEDITISSPFWVDSRKDTYLYTHYIFVDASASTPELALQAANMAAELTVEYASQLYNVSEVRVASEAALTTNSENAADFGSDEVASATTETTETTSTASVIRSSISLKTLVVFGGAGLVLSALLLAAYDIFTRKARSANDVERLLGIPVIKTLKPGDSVASLADDVSVLLSKNGLAQTLCVGCVEEDGAEGIAKGLADAGVEACGACVLRAEAAAAGKIAAADSALVVLRYARASGKAIDELASKLAITQTPVLGCVFIGK